MSKSNIIFTIIFSFILTACDSNNQKIKETLERFQSTPIDIPYDKFSCWTSDSIRKISPWKHATLKLVHYVDSSQCTSCYLSKMMVIGDFLNLEKESNEKFYNIFIVDPGVKKMNRLILKKEYDNKEIPTTLFIDTMQIFIKKNPAIPKEIAYHTFLVDEKNNVIFVGSPYINDVVREKTINIIKEKLKKIK